MYASAVATELAITARPRYHVAGGQGLFYARPPYANPDLGAGQRPTRFVGLGSVTGAAPYPATAPGGGGAGLGRAAAGSGAAKWLHALGLPPAALMTTDALAALPDGTTPCPYPNAGGLELDRKRRVAFDVDGPPRDAHCSWRWMQPKRMRGGGSGGGGGGGRMHQSGAPPFVPWGRAGVVMDSARSVFVRNLPDEATLEEVAGFFSQAGQVIDGW